MRRTLLAVIAAAVGIAGCGSSASSSTTSTTSVAKATTTTTTHTKKAHHKKAHHKAAVTTTAIVSNIPRDGKNFMIPPDCMTYFGALCARSFLMTFPPFITNLTR